jgi:hypothetical protein
METPMIVFFNGPLPDYGWMPMIAKEQGCDGDVELTPYQHPVLGVSPDGDCRVYTAYPITTWEAHDFLFSCVEYFAKKVRLTV